MSVSGSAPGSAASSPARPGEEKGATPTTEALRAVDPGALTKVSQRRSRGAAGAGMRASSTKVPGTGTGLHSGAETPFHDEVAVTIGRRGDRVARSRAASSDPLLGSRDTGKIRFFPRASMGSGATSERGRSSFLPARDALLESTRGGAPGAAPDRKSVSEEYDAGAVGPIVVSMLEGVIAAAAAPNSQTPQKFPKMTGSLHGQIEPSSGYSFNVTTGPIEAIFGSQAPQPIQNNPILAHVGYSCLHTLVLRRVVADYVAAKRQPGGLSGCETVCHVLRILLYEGVMSAVHVLYICEQAGVSPYALMPPLSIGGIPGGGTTQQQPNTLTLLNPHGTLTPATNPTPASTADGFTYLGLVLVFQPLLLTAIPYLSQCLGPVKRLTTWCTTLPGLNRCFNPRRSRGPSTAYTTGPMYNHSWVDDDDGDFNFEADGSHTSTSDVAFEALSSGASSNASSSSDSDE